MSKRILLIGDNAVDVFLMVDCHRISPERPVPVLTPHSVRQNPGMGGNVLANLNSLAPDVEVTVLFPPTPSVKTRYVDRGSNQHFVRVDQDVVAEPLSLLAFLDVIDTQKWDAVILSDYSKGFLNTEIMCCIARECEERDIPTYLDTKSLLGEWSQSATVVKINSKEYASQFAAGVKEPWLQCKNLIVTQGANGMMLLDEEGDEEYRTAPNAIDLRDQVGCGDTALAGLVVGYLETQDLARAMDFADKAASIAASKIGVVAVKREEIV